jgi:hypothetical protein
MKKLAILVAFGGMLAGCGQQAAADLGVCKTELTKAQTELAATVAARTTAEQRVAALDAQVKQAQAQVAALQSAAAAKATKPGKPAAVKKPVAKTTAKPKAKH